MGPFRGAAQGERHAGWLGLTWSTTEILYFPLSTIHKAVYNNEMIHRITNKVIPLYKDLESQNGSINLDDFEDALRDCLDGFYFNQLPPDGPKRVFHLRRIIYEYWIDPEDD